MIRPWPPKIRNFSSFRKVMNERFSILFRAYFNVLESFWVDLVVLLVWPVEILQCLKIGQNWPNRRYGPTLTVQNRFFSSFRKVINLRFQVIPRYYSDVLESLRVEIVVLWVCLVVIRQHLKYVKIGDMVRPWPSKIEFLRVLEELSINGFLFYQQLIWTF